MDVLNPVVTPVAPAPPEWFVPYAADPNAVRAFCERHDVRAEVETAVRLALECFKPEQLTLEVVDDPEEDRDCLLIMIIVKASLDELFAAKDCYHGRLILAVPLNKIPLICLDYGFA